MIIFDFIFFVFYCLTLEDIKCSRHDRVANILHFVLFLLLSLFSFLMLGLVNVRITDLVEWAVIIGSCGLISYLLIQKYYIKSSRYLDIIDKYSTRSKRIRIFYAVLAIFIVLFAIVLLFVSGAFMSYLHSVN